MLPLIHLCVTFLYSTSEKPNTDSLTKNPKNLPLVLIVFLEILRATVLIELTSISLGFNSEWHFTVATQGSLSAAMVPGCRCGYRG